MKKSVLIMMMALGAAVLLGACKEKKEVTDTAEYADFIKIPTPGAPKTLVQPAVDVPATWQGVACQVNITCQSADSLQMVYDEFGQPYKDNVFDVGIQKGDGSVLYRQRFTKQMFLPKIKDENDRALYAKKAVLRSVSAEVKDGVFQYFNVSLQLPDAVDDDDILFNYYTNGNFEQVSKDYMYDEMVDEGV